jgi:dUTP pyrophosphatase
MRKFEVVSDQHREHKRFTPSELFDNKIEGDGKRLWVPDIKLPRRADPRSSGYDFYLPVPITILPKQLTFVQFDVKVMMPDDEWLQVLMRSSLAMKRGIILINAVGNIDSSYYNNPTNDGNIGAAFYNTSGTAVHLNAGERVVQGVFSKYYVTDDDQPTSTERVGGFGSSGR